MSTTVTIPHYAKKIKKCSRQAVLKAVQKNKLHLLPGVIKTTKVGRDYLLEITSH
jgi:hypothetical protein